MRVGHAQVVAAGRDTALSAAQELVCTQNDNDNDNVNDNDNDNGNGNGNTVQQRQNPDWALGAYGSTFVLAPSFCLRLRAEDSLLLEAAVRHEGLAVLLQSELSGRHAHLLTPTVVNTPACTPACNPTYCPTPNVGRPELTRCDFGVSVAPGLTEHAHRVWTDENAGGSSRNSEAMSMELLR